MPLELYQNRVVTLSLIVNFTVGFGMFGAIIFVPLFFQGVLGSSATSSGSFLTPMMLGVVVGAAVAGQALSRTGGHYRVQGLVGIAVMGTGLFLMSQMSAETSHARAVFNIVVMGLGMGTTFPTYTIAVQNAVPHAIMGAATSATQFYRTIGGTLGLALMGSLMVSHFASGLEESVTPAMREALPAGQGIASLAANPQALINSEALSDLRSAIA